jgi:hypothetical protein
MQKVQCPSCGAAATNLLNCEFCGSLFVRYQAYSINTDNLFNECNEFIGFSYAGIQYHLKENIENQKAGKKYITEITASDHTPPIFITIEGVGDTPSLPISITWSSVEDLKIENKFHKLKESLLFKRDVTRIDTKEELRTYSINFGEDYIGATHLISILLKDVYELPKNYEDLNICSGVWNERKNVDNPKKGCFIATAAMGSYDDPLVFELRDFRDNWILKKSWGNKFVNWYYKYGAIAAMKIKNSFFLKKLSFLLIVKPVFYLSRILNRK